MRVLVTGAKGQLGRCIKVVSKDYTNIKFLFTDTEELNITQKENVENYFLENSFDYVINCAAYTDVEKAEKEPEKAFLVNATGVKHLTEACKNYNVVLIHISTDYVFDGEKESPYTEEDVPNPINEYGKSKLLGEIYIQEILEKYFIIRTSWLYSQFGKNFYKTILEKSEKLDKLTIVDSEFGTPTNANDLARFVLDLLRLISRNYGIYHYSNEGKASWFNFAYETLKISRKLESIKLKKTDNYPTFAKRPTYSVLSKKKVIENFDCNILEWKESLKTLMKK